MLAQLLILTFNGGYKLIANRSTTVLYIEAKALKNHLLKSMNWKFVIFTQTKMHNFTQKP
jgi:hypothetical protein